MLMRMILSLNLGNILWCIMIKLIVLMSIDVISSVFMVGELLIV